jgi:ribosomal protein L11 methylase PrmA
MASWQILRIHGKHAEELSPLLFDYVRWARVLDEETIELSYSLSAEQEALLLQQIHGYGLLIVSQRSESDDDGEAAFSQLHWPIQVATFRFSPIDGKPPFALPGIQDFFLQPGYAFGTGHHAATALLLRAIDEIPTVPALQHCADIGCGSGILALAMAYRFQCPCYVTDTDSRAIELTQKNAAFNNLHNQIQSYPVGSKDFPKVNLLCANIFSETLKSLSEYFSEILQAEGRLLVSGILLEQAEEVRAHFQQDAWQYIQRQDRDGWSMLEFRNRNT